MRGLTHHSRRDPRKARRGRAEVLGTFSARAHGRTRNSAVRATVGFTPLGLGEASVFRQRDASQRPIHKKDMTRDCCCTPHLHHVLCSAHTYTCATARRDSFHFISFHFISFHFISFHFISFHFISFHFISFHFISFHFISFHFISFHFISFHFISFNQSVSATQQRERSTACHVWHMSAR